MFCAEIIAFDEERRPNHVYNLLVTLQNLSANKRRYRDANLSTEFAPLQPGLADKGWLTRYKFATAAPVMLLLSDIVYS